MRIWHLNPLMVMGYNFEIDINLGQIKSYAHCNLNLSYLLYLLPLKYQNDVNLVP